MKRTIVAVVTVLAVMSATASAQTTWKGVNWETYGSGTATVDGSGHLLLAPGGSAEFGVHVNRLPVVTGGDSSINASGTPWIEFSYYDTGISDNKIEMIIDDEVTVDEPLISAGSLWSAGQVLALRYGPPGGRLETYAFFDKARANVLHNVLVGKLADGTVWVRFDGQWRPSSFLKDGVGGFNFNDVYLRVRGADGSTTVTFTDFAFGDNFSLGMVPALTRAGHRLVQLQQNDGGWDWPLDDGDPNDASPLNTIGPIAQGLAKAYLATHDATMKAALEKAGTFLLSKTNNFSPSDGYLALQLDLIFGGTTYRDDVVAKFYGPLAAGTYDRNGAGTLYDTADYVSLIDTARAGQGIPNLAAWDIGMGLVGAASCGVSGTELDWWIDGVKAEINELTVIAGEECDVIGLAGAVYALAFVGEDYDPTTGMHAGASCLKDLADILAGYQQTNGGFTHSANDLDPAHAMRQETAYAMLALAEVSASSYRTNLSNASAFLKARQLATGGWENCPGDPDDSGENNEVTAEAAWGVAVADAAKLTLDVPSASLYVQTGDLVLVDLNVSDLLTEVKACQAVMGYDSGYLTCLDVAPGSATVWNDVIYESYSTPGEIDTAIGVKGSTEPGEGTSDDGTVAKITLRAGPEGTTQVVFRSDVSDVESTFLSDMSAQTVWPTKIDSLDIVIDNTEPAIAITSAKQGGQELIGTSVNAVQGVVDITVTASDALAGLDGVPAVTVMPFSAVPMPAAFVDESPAGTFNYTFTVTAAMPNGVATIEASVSDLSGNSAIAPSKTFNINKNRITGAVELEGIVDGAYRDVTFVATGGDRAEWTVTIGPFSGTTHAASFTLDDVPDDVTHLSAKTAWNLRSKVAVTFDADGQASPPADLTGAEKLRGGDLNGTNSVNVLDYTILKTRWYTTEPEGDIDASGEVNVADYTLMKGNWYQVGEEE